MNISFCLTSDFSDLGRVNEIIQSIRNLAIPNYEILIIGANPPANEHDVRYIDFDESVKSSWITRKKNILCQEAKYDNIVLFHDYFVFYQNWYIEFLKFGEDWDVCSNAQMLISGQRHFTDWIIWDHPELPRYFSLPYNDWSNTKHMYISGNYFLAKKKFMLNNPLNEDLSWGESEDIEWSLRIRDKAVIKCNGKSIVKHNKAHRDARW